MMQKFFLHLLIIQLSAQMKIKSIYIKKEMHEPLNWNYIACQSSVKNAMQLKLNQVSQ